jgi:tRNA G37 N-methylase Trm5
MTATRILTMDDAIKVVVIDSLEQITTYVLEEQLDWFEDELNALRRILKPGQTVLDIGANLGMYALSMARVVGQEGRVIAFEPASNTAALLQQSADLNGFSQIEVDARAVGDRSGTARLTLDLNPELNRIEDTTSDPEATDASKQSS